MFKKALIFGVVGFLVLGIAAVAFAAPGGRWGGGFGQAAAGNTNWAPPVTQLGLSDEQYAKLREIQNQAFEKLQALRDEMAKKMLELKNLYLQKDPDKNAIEAKQKELSELRDKMLQLRQDNINEANKVLTQEQLDKLNSLRGNGFGRGAGFGPGACHDLGGGFGWGMMGGYGSGVNQ
ncbi:MAG: Spy/CpxP family protein refolding chaperone [Tepidanaerobacteraceae bacterium]|jgi:Spy/CpxP family protein refolding chaperone|nr:Spy/CpxP family protein refolding chaperone [Tepidanaerobacteraceae bacterium]